MSRAHYTPQSTASADSAPVAVPMDGVVLAGDLCIPRNAKGVVVFAHGSGSSRFSPRNRYVAEVLQEHVIGTLLIDLLTQHEEQIDEQTRELRFNIPLLAERLEKIGEWILDQPQLQNVKLGYFGASTGGAAALIAAATQPDRVAAVVSRGGRPDLAAKILPTVQAPALLIVGANDPEVLKLNRQALALLNDRSQLEIVPYATHLFEEPGTLEAVAQLAAEWFEKHFE
jgi:putative phosphoribosyl transferase